MLPGALATDLAMALATAKVLPLATTTVMATLLVMPPASILTTGLATEVRPLPLVTVTVLLTRQALITMSMLLTIIKEVLIRQQTMVHSPWSMLWTLQHMKRKLPMNFN